MIGATPSAVVWEQVPKALPTLPSPQVGQRADCTQGSLRSHFAIILLTFSLAALSRATTRRRCPPAQLVVVSQPATRILLIGLVVLVVAPWLGCACFGADSPRLAPLQEMLRSRVLRDGDGGCRNLHHATTTGSTTQVSNHDPYFNGAGRNGPATLLNTAVRYVLERRERSKDPVIIKNADETLSHLLKLH
jgi:hypothetical protein